MFLKGKDMLYVMCSIIALVTFNKIDKTILFMTILFMVYKFINKKAEVIC